MKDMDACKKLIFFTDQTLVFCRKNALCRSLVQRGRCGKRRKGSEIGMGLLWLEDMGPIQPQQGHQKHD